MKIYQFPFLLSVTTPDHSTLENKMFLTCCLRQDRAHSNGKAWRWEQEVFLHMASSVRKQREAGSNGPIIYFFSSYYSVKDSSLGNCATSMQGEFSLLPKHLWKHAQRQPGVDLGILNTVTRKTRIGSHREHRSFLCNGQGFSVARNKLNKIGNLWRSFV